MCGVDLKKASLEDRSNPWLMVFIKMKMEIPNKTPKIATVVARLPDLKYVNAICLFTALLILFL